MKLTDKQLEASEKLRRWRERPSVMVRDLFGAEPEPWQEQALDQFPSSPRMALKASKGPGKAQPKSTLIDTPSGKKKFGSLRVGDFVFAIDGMPTRVTGVYDRGIRTMYRVTFDDGSSTLACGEHLWRVRGSAERARVGYDKTDPESGWVVLSTEQIIARGVRNRNGVWNGRQFEIPLHGAVYYPKADLPFDPYIMGAWIGDGCRGTGKIAAKKNDDVEYECRKRGAKGTRSPGDSFYVAGLLDVIRRYDIADKHSYEKFIPNHYLQGDEVQRLDLLRGLMDTDGYIDTDSTCEFATTSKQLAEDVVWLVRSLGGRAFICDGIKKPFYYGHAKKKIHGRLCYRVRVRLPVNPFIMPMKAERWRSPYQSPETLRYMKRYIDKIEEDGEQDCCCIAVQHPTKCYLTNDFIVTHNTCVEAWLIWNFLLTRPHPKIACTAIDAKNLSDNLWTELALWRSKSPQLQEIFEWTKTRIFSKRFPETWWCSARTWSKTADRNAQSNTLAGLHAEYIMFVLDESGGMPDAIMASAEAALSSCKEGHILQAGNPTHLEGPLYAACTKERRLWNVIEINADPDSPTRARRVSIEWARQQIEKYGRNNPWVLVNVFGQFPPASLNALIGPDEVEAAMKRYYRAHEIGNAAKILGVDVARFGDDASKICPRQGIQVFPFKTYRNINSTQGAGAVSRLWQDFGAHACFIDDTGGFGSGWIDQLITLGRSPVGVHFSGEAHNKQRYFNKRAEMAFEAVEWIKRGGALPEDCHELLAALTQTTYTFQGDKLLLEPKEDIKVKLGYSPDEFDSFIVTFAHPVTVPDPLPRNRQNAALQDYNPYKEQEYS